MDVALVVDARNLSEPDCANLLLPALARRGLSAALVAWDDPAMDWSTTRLAVIRATWDYHLRLPEFLAWAERAAERCDLLNPLPAVRWNARKTYLRDLERRGVPTIPTVWLPRGSSASLAPILRERDWERAVLKPVVSASAYETRLVTPSSLAEDERRLARMLTARDMMLQPYLAAVATTGERSLVFIGGEHTHTFLRVPALGSSGASPTESALLPNDPAEEAFARPALQASGCETLYTRVDLIHDDTGAPRLMELELIEPSLALSLAPAAAERLAAAIARRLV